jgi:protein-S-isoprenylcysteine O-methyltransferase Ste14
MNGDLPFRVVFFAAWIIFIDYFLCREYTTRESSERFSIVRHMEQATRREGRARIIARAILAPFWLLGFVLYAAYPNWMTTFTIPLPEWFRWIMLAVSIVTVPFMMWGYHTLGKAWTPPKLLLRKEHVLVRNGPYRYVRHPIYTAALTFMITLALATANWLILLPMIAGSVLIYAQVGREEAILIDRFGNEYREYMNQTPRIIPKFRNLAKTKEPKAS